MVKRALCSIALAAALISFAQPAAPQSNNGTPNYNGTPKPAISDYGPFPKVGFKDNSVKPASGKCGNPAGACLFYGGDLFYSPFYPNVADGLANETTVSVAGTPYGAAVWSPFTVPAGQTWDVTGLFTNDQANYGVLDQFPTEPYSAAYWSINEGVFPGTTGTVVASGTSAATSTPTGREAFGLGEYTIQVTGLSIVLTPGTYWMIVVPICTNTSDVFCKGGVFFESDVEYINRVAKNTFGPAEPIDASFFDSPYFAITVEQTNSPVGACGGFGCDQFSAGVLGTKAN